MRTLPHLLLVAAAAAVCAVRAPGAAVGVTQGQGDQLQLEHVQQDGLRASLASALAGGLGGGSLGSLGSDAAALPGTPCSGTFNITMRPRMGFGPRLQYTAYEGGHSTCRAFSEPVNIIGGACRSASKMIASRGGLLPSWSNVTWDLDADSDTCDVTNDNIWFGTNATQHSPQSITASFGSGVWSLAVRIVSTTTFELAVRVKYNSTASQETRNCLSIEYGSALGGGSHTQCLRLMHADTWETKTIHSLGSGGPYRVRIMGTGTSDSSFYVNGLGQFSRINDTMSEFSLAPFFSVGLLLPPKSMDAHLKLRTAQANKQSLALVPFRHASLQA